MMESKYEPIASNDYPETTGIFDGTIVEPAVNICFNVSAGNKILLMVAGFCFVLFSATSVALHGMPSFASKEMSRLTSAAPIPASGAATGSSPAPASSTGAVSGAPAQTKKPNAALGRALPITHLRDNGCYEAPFSVTDMDTWDLIVLKNSGCGVIERTTSTGEDLKFTDWVTYVPKNPSSAAEKTFNPTFVSTYEIFNCHSDYAPYKTLPKDCSSPPKACGPPLVTLSVFPTGSRKKCANPMADPPGTHH